MHEKVRSGKSGSAETSMLCVRGSDVEESGALIRANKIGVLRVCVQCVVCVEVCGSEASGSLRD